VIGTNTVECMQSGVFWGYVGLVRGICDRVRGEYEGEASGPMQIIGTGGLASLFSQGDVLFDRIEDDLTMHGLTVIYNHNKDLGAI
jgi:type III pantothenate kinase